MEPDKNMTPSTDAANQASQPMQQATAAPVEAKDENAMGPMIGVIIIVLLLVAGGFYYYVQGTPTTSTEDTEMSATPEEQAAAEQAEIEKIAEQSTSSAFSAIEADFNATDASSLDDTLSSIDSELGL